MSGPAVDAPEPRVALVTGASAGIGAATARALGAAGRSMAVGYRSDEEGAKEVVEAIGAAGGRAIAVALDVTDPASVDAAFTHTETELGPVTVLVANAGITEDGVFARMGEDRWRRVLDTNLDGAYRTLHRAVPAMMRARFGRIVTVSSVGAYAGAAGQANYAAAKAGLLGFTKTAAQELARYGITVNALCPGFIETDMVANIPEEAKEKLLKTVPLGRFGKPEEIARAARYLVEDGDYITGQALDINGGVYIRT